MLVALATNPKDFDRAMELAEWLPEVHCEYSRHSAVIVGSSTLDASMVFQLAARFTAAGFKTVTPIQARTEETPSWPNAANAMWRLAAQFVKDQARCPWLWIEPDSIPISPGWLDRIEAEYTGSRKAFMGTLYPMPYNHLNGVAVYPPNIHRFNPLMFNSEFFGKPFDTVRPELTLRDAHITGLIRRGLADPETNTPHTFDNLESLSIIPPDCVLFHGCKDGTLIARLRDSRNPAAPVEVKETFGERLLKGVKKLVTPTSGFYHSGNLGDVSYALPAIRAIGGGELIIGPEQRKTAVCALPIDQKQFEMAKPLWEAQPYLRGVRYSLKYPDNARDLNHFRTNWINRPLCKKHGIDTLCKAHFYELGILSKFNDEEPWLTCGDPIQTGKIIAHRSPRYNAPPTGPEAFPWQRLVDTAHGDMLFVGLESEFDTFCRTFQKKVSFWKVADFMELARIIKGGTAFVGNQSFPLSVAIGLGQRVLVEALPRSPDCRFDRNNYRDQLQGEIKV